MQPKFIKSIQSLDTGGNVRNDIVTLSDGQVIVITLDVIYIYECIGDYDNCENPINFIIR